MTSCPSESGSGPLIPRATMSQFLLRARAWLLWSPSTVTMPKFLVFVALCSITLLISHEIIYHHLYENLNLSHISRIQRSLFRTDRTIRLLRDQYQQMCGHDHIMDDRIRQAITDMVAQPDESQGAVQFGTQMWNRMSLHETINPYRFYGALDKTQTPPPPIKYVLAYGKRLDQGRRMLTHLGANPDESDYVSYPDLETAYEDRARISSKVFTDMASMTKDAFYHLFPPRSKDAGYFLSTLNQWIVMDRLVEGQYPDEIVVVEDDVMPVPDFQRKLNVVRKQLETLPDWEIVFIGTCLGIDGGVQVTANLFQVSTTRCFNGVMLRRSAAEKILGHGAITDSFQAVDHAFNRYITTLNLTTYFVEPPLLYESSKIEQKYPC